MMDFKTKIDNMTDKYALARIGDLILIEHNGFKTCENMAQKMSAMLRGKISTGLRTSKVANIDSLEEYQKLWESSKALFWRTIFCNLYQQNNVDVAEAFLLDGKVQIGEKELLKILFNDGNEAATNIEEAESTKDDLAEDEENPAVSNDETSEESVRLKELQKENQDLKKEISKLTKRMEKNVNGYHVLSEAKAKLDEEHGELMGKYEALEKEYNILKSSLNSSVVLDKRKEEYYNKLFAAQNILMVNMKPKIGVPFPFSYNYINIRAIFSDKLQDIKVSDVWLVKGYYSDIQIEAVISRLEGRYGVLNFREISQEQIELMELEVE